MIKPSFIKAVRAHVVELLLYNDFSCFLRRIGRFILRLFRWIPALWNQEEWDSAYIYDLLELKMRELHMNMSNDTWHDQKSVKRGLRQIEICLMRLNRWRNWPEYYNYPMDDIIHVKTGNGMLQPISTSAENEEQRLGAIKFEQKNYDKFWKDFLAWHRGWWT